MAEPVLFFGIPFDFILFALTLLGIALFHRHTLPIALTGLGIIVAYKLSFTGFKDGAGLAGLGLHLGHEFSLLSNLFLLLMGFALLSRHFEESAIPDEMPALLPDDWKGGVVLLVMVFVLSSFLDNIAAAIIGGTVARHVFGGKVHIGYLAAIVAASNAGGSGSVVGDTTTTMMWVAGVSPLSVLEAYIAAIVALVIFAVPPHCSSSAIRRSANMRAEGFASTGREFSSSPRYWSSRLGEHRHQCAVSRSAWSRAGVGAFRLGVLFATAPLRRPDWERHAGGIQGHDLSARARYRGFDDARRESAGRVMADRVGPRLRLGRVRQHSADRACAQAGRLRLGLSRLCRRVWWLDDLVRFVRRRRAVEPVSGSKIGWAVAQAWLARGACLCRRIFRDAGPHRMAS